MVTRLTESILLSSQNALSNLSIPLVPFADSDSVKAALGTLVGGRCTCQVWTGKVRNRAKTAAWALVRVYVGSSQLLSSWEFGKLLLNALHLFQKLQNHMTGALAQLVITVHSAVVAHWTRYT
jgi:hypothetical protein